MSQTSPTLRAQCSSTYTLEWDRELLELFGIPLSMMPEVKPSGGIMAYTATTIFAHEIPIAGVAGDQQAALFGQMCVRPSCEKHLWHRVLPTHEHRRQAYNLQNRLLSTIARQIGDKVTYALEGSIFVGGPWCNGFAAGCTAYTRRKKWRLWRLLCPTQTAFISCLPSR